MKEDKARQKIWQTSRKMDAVVMLAELKSKSATIANRVDSLAETIALYNAKSGGKPKAEYYDALHHLLIEVDILMEDE